MKALIVCNDTAYFLRHRRRLADLLCEQGHDVTVMAGGPLDQADLQAQWRFKHLPIERFRLNPLSDAALFARTLAHLIFGKPDAIQLITLKPAVFGGLAAFFSGMLPGAPKRVVVTIPGLGRLMSPDSTMAGRGARLSRSIVERIVRLLAHDRRFFFTFETAHDRMAWVNKGVLPADRSVVTRGAGVDQTIFHPTQIERTGGPVKVLFASRLLRSKGLDAFLAAAGKLRGRADIEFLVAGMAEAGDPDSYSERELRENTAIRFLGKVDDMASLLRSVDVVCLPTRYGEGIPRILIEAAATGIASIASRIDGCREIVVDEATGILVAATPLSATVDGVEQAVIRYGENRDLMKRHGDAALSLFLNGHFAEDEIMKTFVDLLSGA